MTALSAAIGERGLIQSEAAEIFGVTQSRIPDLVRGKVKLYSRGTLIGMAATAGVAPIVKVIRLKLPAGCNGNRLPSDCDHWTVWDLPWHWWHLQLHQVCEPHF